MRAQAPAHAASGSNQDRHVMMPSSAIDARPDTRSSCRLSAGSDQARITTSDSPALPPPIPSRHAQIARSHRRIQPRSAASRSRQPLQSSLSKPEPTAKSHSARGTAPAYVPRFRALALFGRRPQERVEGFVMPASKNLHITGSQLISRSLVGAPFLAKASWLYKQDAREVHRSRFDRIFGVCFGLTGKTKRNLINALK